MKINKAQAEIFLSDVPENHRFYASTGEYFSNLEELQNGLKKLKKSDFCFHVNSEKNDFANWVYDCIGDLELAEKIRMSKSKSELSRKLRDRIEKLKKIAGRT